MSNNEDMLLEVANQRFLTDDNCNLCEHKSSVRERCGHVIQTCHHPKLDPEDESPEVDGTMICDWYGEKNYAKAKPTAGGSD